MAQWVLRQYSAQPSEDEGRSRQGQGFHGIHGDIKSKNILRYKNWKDPDDSTKPLYGPLGVLQITDFGLSGFHHTDTAEDIRDKVANYAYKPPEVQMVLPISPSFDIWAMGCLFIDFLTWLVMGPKGVKEFGEMREKTSKGLITDTHPCFYEVRREWRGWRSTTIQVSRGVYEWAENLCESEYKSQFVCDLVELVLSRMLIIEDKSLMTDGSLPSRTRRINASELLKKLRELCGRNQPPSYYTKVTKPLNVPNCKKMSYKIKTHQSMEEVETGARDRWKQQKQEADMKASHPKRQGTGDSLSSVSHARTDPRERAGSGSKLYGFFLGCDAALSETVSSEFKSSRSAALLPFTPMKLFLEQERRNRLNEVDKAVNSFSLSIDRVTNHQVNPREIIEMYLKVNLLKSSLVAWKTQLERMKGWEELSAPAVGTDSNDIDPKAYLEHLIDDYDIRINDCETVLQGTSLAFQLETILQSREDTMIAIKDGKAMKSIAVVTLFFLPGTFFATLLAVPEFKALENITVIPSWSVYLIMFLPSTLILMMGYFWWISRRTEVPFLPTYRRQC
ncbi:Uu.00g140660.m01.CDS01 [Anthostomella pinea]|uniref:Uu.00g140660.m01.CDS01 n=1 Tax=Anthostomella pinea TaxID=933095 RepID=A0AAI8VJP1_9PEZI|nr:Uu.00g140660.m01.CDS01 [Anthostomella pinea]